MGAFSNLDLEQRCGSGGVQNPAQAPAAPQAAQPQSPPASPFVSGAFSGSPFVSMAPAPAATQQSTAPATPQQTTPAIAQSTPTQQPAAQSAPVAVQDNAVQQSAAPAPTPVEQAAEKKPESKPAEEDEAAKRKAHEDAEAKRKAEWEAKFAERRAQEKAERDRVAALSDDAVMAESMARVSKGFEQLTRRNMKDMVSEYVQTMCVSDPVFARNVMNPVKSMVNCVKFINNKAVEYIKKDMENNDMKPENGMYGGDVPDDVVYQWAVDYFNDPNAKEDERPDEKFEPKPYIGKYTPSGKSKKDKDKAKKEAEKKAAEKKAAEEKAKKKADDGQLSLLGAA